MLSQGLTPGSESGEPASVQLRWQEVPSSIPVKPGSDGSKGQAPPSSQGKAQCSKQTVRKSVDYIPVQVKASFRIIT